VIVMLVLAVLAGLIQVLLERHDAAAHPAPGTLVTLADGRSLHLNVTGRENGGPTVVLEAGAGGTSSSWAWVQRQLENDATVVSYDRAGLGWSDGEVHAADAAAVAADLHEALVTLELPRPYVLVGHSLGGHYVRGFAQQYAGEVAGMVLVDPSHEHGSRETGMAPSDMAWMLRGLEVATRLGVTRLYNPLVGDVGTLPEPDRSAALAQLATGRAAAAQRREMLALDAAAEGLPLEGALGARPVRVVVAGGGATDAASAELIESYVDLRHGLTALSTNSSSVEVPDATHVSVLTERRHAALVTDSIRAVVDDVRRGSAL
jgi:pimeloyl-ACP methyl ester carboxylesterase